MKKLLVLGAGESGLGAALLGRDKNWEVFVSDAGSIAAHYKQQLIEKGIAWEEKSHTKALEFNADLVIKSPGIPNHVSVIKEIKAKGIQIIDEIEFAYRYTQKPIYAISGSNGKTTTASMLHFILTYADMKIGLGGNIGTSFASLVREDEKYEGYVIELSSFQLEGIVDFKPHIAILTNLSEDHLDRYDYEYKKYIEAKFRMIMNQTEADYFIYDGEDQEIKIWLDNNQTKSNLLPFSTIEKIENGAYASEENIFVNISNKTFDMPIKQVKVQGKHNVKNAMAASTVAKLLQIRKETIRESLKTFQGVEHRLEPVRKINEVDFINDSKATNVNAAYFALESVKSPTVWIVGGVDKGNDYSELFALVKRKVKHIIALGVDNEKIISAFSDLVQIETAASMKEAVEKAQAIAKSGDTVLLSPACASFDLFANYEARGEAFKEEVIALK